MQGNGESVGGEEMESVMLAWKKRDRECRGEDEDRCEKDARNAVGQAGVWDGAVIWPVNAVGDASLLYSHLGLLVSGSL